MLSDYNSAQSDILKCTNNDYVIGIMVVVLAKVCSFIEMHISQHKFLFENLKRFSPYNVILLPRASPGNKMCTIGIFTNRNHGYSLAVLK